LFDVNIPLLYGEGGNRAFERLQLEIIKRSADESIFAWLLESKDDLGVFGILAPSPNAFSKELKLRTFSPRIPRPPYTMTNKGLHISATLIPAADHEISRRVFLPLCCCVQGEDVPLVMSLISTDTPGTYIRELGTLANSTLQWPQGLEWDLYTTEKRLEVQNIYITKARHFTMIRYSKPNSVGRLRLGVPRLLEDKAQAVFDRYGGPEAWSTQVRPQ
jgi:hypothetical protein